MRKISKHNSRNINFIGLTGGINIAQSGDQISGNEMKKCENFLYERDSKRLAGRGGLSSVQSRFVTKILELFYDVDTNTIVVFLENREIYVLIGVQSVPAKAGSLTGERIPTCCKFQDKLWIASGDKLQYYDFSKGGEIFTVFESPPCDIVFERFARLAVTLTGNDRISYSGIGDGAYWKEDTNDASAAQWIDVGYGDSGNIIAVVPLATDLMILKSNGKVYQFAGDKDVNSWVVYNIGNNADPVGRNCAANIGNSVVFLSRRGFKTLSATMDYGNIAPADIGDKFNALVTENQYEPRMFHLKRHSMILVRPTIDWSYFVCYNYALNAATVIRFGFPVTSVVETADEIIIAADNGLYIWSNEYTYDDAVPINYVIELKDIISNGKLLLKGVDTKFSGDHAGEADILIGTKKVGIPTHMRRKIHCNHSTSCISLEISAKSRFILDHVVLEVADL